MKSALGAGFNCAVHSFLFSLFKSWRAARILLKKISFTWNINKLVIQQS
jgi:hypothetical protein